MAYIQTLRPTLKDSLSVRIGRIAENFKRYRLYRRTVNELEALSGRDLADMGISRGSIHSIAYEAAYLKG
ncbi:DUF1127 domain-containing protein [Brevirhabdus sp.]|uniref:DUF1127 domain-containing protein n=1 Tax=Brevirhabdus sp. TaxID=2004514 RepID=UPI00405A2245